MTTSLTRFFRACLLAGCTTGALAAQPVLTMVAAGEEHFAALDQEGGLWVWGGNDAGQLGLGDDAELAALAKGQPMPRNRPLRLGGGYRYVAASGQSTMAIKADGSLWGWGRNVAGLDKGKTYHQPTLVMRAPVKEVHPGASFAFVRDAHDALWRLGKDPEARMPTYYAGGVRQLAVSGEHAVVVMHDNTAWTYGGKRDAALLGRAAADVPTLAQVGIDDYVSGTTDEAFTLLKRRDGSNEFFGDMRYLQPALAQSRGIYHYRDQYAGQLQVYLLDNAGALSMVEVAHSDGKPSPAAPVALGAGFASVKSSYSLLIALKDDATVWAWGERRGGVPGLSDPAPVAAPQRVMFPEVSAGAAK